MPAGAEADTKEGDALGLPFADGEFDRVVAAEVLEHIPADLQDKAEEFRQELLDVVSSGSVGKGGDAGELLNAVRNAVRGKRYLGSSIARNMALASVGGDESPFDQLSPRELEVAMLLVQGMRQDAIARRLSLSPKTVNTHKSRLFDKIGVEDNIALARLAARYGLMDPATSL